MQSTRLPYEGRFAHEEPDALGQRPRKRKGLPGAERAKRAETEGAGSGVGGTTPVGVAGVKPPHRRATAQRVVRANE